MSAESRAVQDPDLDDGDSVALPRRPFVVQARSAADAVIARASRLRARLGDRTVFFGTFVVLFSGLLFRNRWVFSRHVTEYGDEALNSLLVRKALRFHLLVGNYSRVGFHHPGPAFMDNQAIGQGLFYDLLHLVPAPFNGQLVAVMAMNCLMLAAVVRIVWRHTGSLACALLAAVVPYTYLAFPVAGGDPIASTWMPDQYLVPVLLLIFSAAAVSTGRLTELPYLAFSCLYLWHGHVSFLLIATAIAATAVALPAVRRVVSGSWSWSFERRPALIAAGWVLLFALPLVLNLALHWPGEFGKYLHYSQSPQAGHHSLSQAVHYMASYWSTGSHPFLELPVVYLAALCCAITFPDTATRRFFTGAVVAGAMASLMLVYYATDGIDDLSASYIGMWSMMVVPALLLVIACRLWTLFRRIPTVLPRVVIVGAAVAALVVAMTAPHLENLYTPGRSTPQAFKSLQTVAGGRTIMIDVGADIGPDVPGIVLQAARQGDRACVTDPAMALFLTSDYICTDADRASGTLFYASRRPQEKDGLAVAILGGTEFSLKPRS